MQKFLSCFACAGLALGFVGCSDTPDDRLALVTAAGSVTLDGQSKGDITLNFTPVKAGEDDRRQNLMATVAADGKFMISTYEPGDGAAPGQYTVTMTEGAGSSASDPSVDPAAMMSQMGGGSGSSTAPCSVVIPKEGASDLKVELVTSEKKPPKKGSGRTEVLGQ